MPDTSRRSVFFRRCPSRPPLPTYPLPSRSGRLLSLVLSLIDYGNELAATLRQGAVPSGMTSLARTFGTSDLALILARVAQGLLRAGLLREKITRTADRIDAEPQPKPAPHGSVRPGLARGYRRSRAPSRP